MTTRSPRTLTGYECSTCGLMKPVDDFYADPRGGIRARCKECMNKVSRERRAADPDARSKDAARRQRAAGVIAENQRLWRERHPEMALFLVARVRARRYKREFTIQVTDIVVPDKCPLLGVPLIPGTKHAPSVDRIDNTKGYVPGNVWVISSLANSIKGKRTVKEAFPCAQIPTSA